MFTAMCIGFVFGILFSIVSMCFIGMRHGDQLTVYTAKKAEEIEESRKKHTP